METKAESVNNNTFLQHIAVEGIFGHPPEKVRNPNSQWQHFATCARRKSGKNFLEYNFMQN